VVPVPVMVVGFSTTKAWISWIIRKMTGSPVSHAFLRFAVGGYDVVLQADHRGVGVISWKRFAGACSVVAQYGMRLPWEGLLPEIVDQLGTGYDVGGLVGQGVMILGNALGRHWENPFQNDDQWYCSEFVAHLLELCGEKLPAKPSAISPAVLLELCRRSAHAARVG
jgi:hypothetical protein